VTGALDVLHALRLENGRAWGDVAVSWQREDAEAVLEPGGGPRMHYLLRPRGASKTMDLAAVVVAALVEQAPARSRSYGGAADRDQAGLLIDALAGLVERSGLGGVLRVDNFKVTNTRTGATFEALASDEASSWGLRPWLTVCDEFTAWPATRGPRRFWRSLVSAQPKVPGSRLVILGTPGDPGHWSSEVRSQAEASSRWRVRRVEGPVPWLDDRDLEELRRLLPPWEYERLVLGRFATADDQPFALADLRACLRDLDDPAPRAGVRYVLAVDLGWRSDATVLAVAHREPALTVVDRLERYVGSRAREVDLSAVESRVYELARRYNSATVRMDPAQGIGAMQRLRAKGLKVVEHTFTTASNTRLAMLLHSTVREHRLSLPETPELVEEFLAVRLRELGPGIYRLDTDAGGHDDQVVAVGMAAVHLVGDGPGRPGMAFNAAGRILDRAPVLDLAGREVRFQNGAVRPLSNREAHAEVFGDDGPEPLSDAERTDRARWRDLAAQFDR
jgi:hypothetical protein